MKRKMTIRYIVILLTFISCAKNTKEPQEPSEKAQNATSIVGDVPTANDTTDTPADIETSSPTSEKNKLLEAVLQQLELERSQIKEDLVVSKVQPHSPNETIIVIPEISVEDEDYIEFNSHIVLVNNTTHKITHNYFESAKTNDWISDAILLAEIGIDTAPYKVARDTRAFSVTVYRYNNSKPNPYSNKTMSLFVKSGATLKKVLRDHTVMNSGGEWDTSCYGEFRTVKNTFIMSKDMTNGYFDIIVKSTITETKTDEDEQGECQEKEIVSKEIVVLKFNRKQYKKLDLLLQTKLKATEKYGTPSFTEQFILNDAQGEFRNIISNAYTEKERQSESIVIDEITWEKDKTTWITLWYEVKDEASAPKGVLVWKKGTEF